MPAFDPDMELRGLILTIPTWMNAIARAQSKTDMSLISNGMKQSTYSLNILLEYFTT